MRKIYLLAAVVVVALVAATEAQQLPPYSLNWFDQYTDHFNFATQPQKWQQRWLYVDQYWNKKAGAPILFYSGNEGDIFMFYNNTGFIFELAQQFGAIVIFAEHRYYGQSLPYGSNSFTPTNLALCTVEQALADYAVLLTDFKKKNAIFSNSPVITVGGSYGGMLSAWFRIKYPHIVEGALAASAPILQFHGVRSDYIFYQIVTQDYAAASPLCSTGIQKAFQMIASLGKQGQYSRLTSAFRTCRPIQSSSDVDALSNWLNTAFTYMAMTDYPYPTNFLQPLPGWPVTASCQPIIARGSSDLLSSVADAAGVYYNTSGSQSCFDIWNADISPSLGNAWNYQACTELNLNTASNGVTDMFPPAPFDEKAIAASCMQQFGVTPRDDWIMTWYGGLNITSSSNIIFSNGALDPWSGGGVLNSLSDSLIAIMIDQAAHHLDLRFSDPRDPPSVVSARKQEASILRQWLGAFYARNKMSNPLTIRQE